MLFIVQQQVINYILNHGGTDTQASDFIFHFQTFQDLLAARDSMRMDIQKAFNKSVETVNEINAILQHHHLPPLPAPVPMADAYIIMKTAVIATDYRADTGFFRV